MPRTVWAGRVRKNGEAVVMGLPPEVRRAMGVMPGDLLIYRLYGPYMIARRMAPDQVLEVEHIPTAALPPTGQRVKTDASL